MGHGGRRSGAGRPKGAKDKALLAREALRVYFEEQAVKEFAPIFAQYVKRAKGLETNADPRILIDFMNRILGRPVEAVELSGVAGEALTVRVVHREVRA